MMRARLSKCILVVTVCVMGTLFFGCVVGSETAQGRLAAYAADDNEKEMSRWLFRREGGVLERSELEALVPWSIEHRWKFLKLVDHFEGTKREVFLREFPIVLKSSPSSSQFVAAFTHSPSRTIQEILALGDLK